MITGYQIRDSVRDYKHIEIVLNDLDEFHELKFGDYYEVDRACPICPRSRKFRTSQEIRLHCQSELE